MSDTTYADFSDYDTWHQQFLRAREELLADHQIWLDALGEPIDPSPAGRLKFECAFVARQGVPWTCPTLEEPNADHRAGLHPDPTARGWNGDMSCDDCLEDELWVEKLAPFAALLAEAREPDRRTRHLAWIFSDKRTLTLPVSQWMDQVLIRSRLAEAGVTLPEYDQTTWLNLVFRMLDEAEVQS